MGLVCMQFPWGEAVNRRVTLAVLVVIACFAFWYSVRKHRENVFQEELDNALNAHAGRNDLLAEQILQGLLPKVKEWWPNGPHHIETLCWLGTVLRVQLKYKLAEPELREAVGIAEESGTPSTIAVGRAKLNLGIIARDETDDVEAQKLFADAAQILAKNPQAAWGDDAAALLNLGFLADKQGRYQEAESDLLQSISSYERIFHNSPEPDLANAHFHLAEVYRHLDQFDLAAEQYQAALSMYERIEGPGGKDTRHSAMGLAIAQEHHGNVAQAETSAQQALGDDKKPADLDGASLNNLANLARDTKNYLEAESLYKQSAAAYEKSGGQNDLGLATPLANLGKLYRDVPQFDITKAEPLLKRALAIREGALGPDHPETAKALSDLSLLYSYEKKPAEAEKFAQRSLPLEEKTFGTESLEVSTTLNRLGMGQRDEGKFTDAEQTLKRALAIREAKHAPQQWIAISLANLASVYELDGQQAKATPLIARARLLQTQSSR